MYQNLLEIQIGVKVKPDVVVGGHRCDSLPYIDYVGLHTPDAFNLFLPR